MDIHALTANVGSTMPRAADGDEGPSPSRITLSTRSALPRSRPAPGAQAVLPGNATTPLNAAGVSGRVHSEIDIDNAPGLHWENLMALAEDTVAEDGIGLRDDAIEQFLAARTEAIQTGDFSEALKCYLKVHNLDTAPVQKEMSDGFKNAGRVYSLRGTPSTILNLAPALLTVLAHNAAPVASRNWAIGRLVAAVGCALGGGVVNALAVTHLLACHDLSFRHAAPDVQPELKTPQFKAIKQDLTVLAAEVEAKIETIQGALRHAMQSPSDTERTNEVAKLFQEAHAMIDAGVHTYLTRCQLNHVFFQGLSSQSFLATLKLYVNLASSWVGFAAQDPRMSAAMQLAGCVVQVVGNFFVGPHDKVTEQTQMYHLKIMTGSDREKLRDGIRRPLKIRADMLKAVLAFKTTEIEEEIASHLKLAGPQQWRDYARLRDRQAYPGKLAFAHQALASAFDTLAEPERHSIREKESALRVAIDKRDYRQAHALYETINDLLEMPPGTYQKHVEVKAREQAFQPLTAEENLQWTTLAAAVEQFEEAFDGAAWDKYSQLTQSWEDTRHDADHVGDRRFTAVSMTNQPLVLEAMTVSDSLWKGPGLSSEYKVGVLEDGRRRSKGQDEMTANVAAAQWKTWQFGVGGAYGAVILSAIFGLITEQKKINDPEYEQPLWQNIAATSLVGMVLLFNMLNSYRSIRATPNQKLSTAMYLQMLAGTSGSGAEGVYFGEKLELRKEYRSRKAAGEFQRNGFFHKETPAYLWELLVASASNLGVLYTAGHDATSAKAEYDQVLELKKMLSSLVAPPPVVPGQPDPGLESSQADQFLPLDDRHGGDYAALNTPTGAGNTGGVDRHAAMMDAPLIHDGQSSRDADPVPSNGEPNGH